MLGACVGRLVSCMLPLEEVSVGAAPRAVGVGEIDRFKGWSGMGTGNACRLEEFERPTHLLVQSSPATVVVVDEVVSAVFDEHSLAATTTASAIGAVVRLLPVIGLLDGPGAS